MVEQREPSELMEGRLLGNGGRLGLFAKWWGGGDDLLCGAAVIGDTSCRSYVVGFQVSKKLTESGLTD